ncbi:MAG TPA: hypothetical protein RMH85_21420 [Polyangiaceae bacterium LLY-WYZ-15_(1-7)]|nr:hypothetical protein [Myxococcales bacterium]MAT24365.1 hypothetical protein [Sandaracinus sp.]HJK90860.1 hypothetical protein [Polyangiaceae bacterium LLY-WYZ-15_(1-7)]MBJ72253.1 hypothetical protein [Sandaracinus sp.]HJL02080.1 hypothetical protein [Polyangiaceae bacterium LLY-WYZ-15_(1-7)]
MDVDEFESVRAEFLAVAEAISRDSDLVMRISRARRPGEALSAEQLDEIRRANERSRKDGRRLRILRARLDQLLEDEEDEVSD